jgi:hypothetical protein
VIRHDCGGARGLREEESLTMKMPMSELPVIVEIGGVSVRGVTEGGMLIHRMTFPAGTDFTPFLSLCEAQHWGTVLEGELHVRYGDGTEEAMETGSVYYLRPGHTIWFEVDTTVLEVSPDRETREVFDRVLARVQGVAAGVGER